MGSVQEGEIAVPREVREQIAWISQAELWARGRGVLDDLPSSARVAAAELFRAAESVEEASAEGCHVVISEGGGSKPEVVAANKAETASHAFIGEVLASEPGLAQGSPATLYEVRVEHVLRWPEDAVLSQTAFVLHYGGPVVIEGRVFCAESASRGRALPQLGLEVAILVDEALVDLPVLIHARSGSLYFETPQRTTAATGNHEEAEQPDWADFVQVLLRK